MTSRQLFGGMSLLLCFALMAFTQSEQVPAFNASAPAKGAKLPPIVPRSQRIGQTYSEKYQQVAYDVAAKIPRVIYQLPCYCYCDRIGHKSLRTCYESA